MGLTKSDVRFMSLANGLIVGNLYYCQPLTILIATEFNILPSAAGQTSFYTQLGYAMGLLFIYPLGDKFDRKKLLLFSTSIAFIALIIAATAKSFTILKTACFLIGLFSLAPQMILSLSVVLSSTEEKGKVLGYVMSGLLFGAVFSRVLSGFIGHLYGWRTMFALASLISLAVIGIIHFRFKECKTGFLGNYKSLMKSIFELVINQPVLRKRAAINFFVFMINGCFWTTLVLLLSKAPHNFKTNEIGLFGIIVIVGAISTPFIGKWNDKGIEKIIISIGLLLLLFSQFISYLFSYQLLLFIFSAVLFEIGQQAVRVSNQNAVLALIPEARNRLNTVLMTASFIGSACGASMGLYLWEFNGWKAICLASMLIITIAAVIYFVSLKNKQHIKK